MAVAMGLTDWLAAVIGMYFVAAGAMVAARPGATRRIADDLAGQPALCYVSGLVALAIGAAMVGGHNRWNGLLESFVSLVGWIALLEGILLIAFQDKFVGIFSGANWTDRVLAGVGIATVLLGAILLGASVFS